MAPATATGDAASAGGGEDVLRAGGCREARRVERVDEGDRAGDAAARRPDLPGRVGPAPGPAIPSRPADRCRLLSPVVALRPCEPWGPSLRSGRSAPGCPPGPGSPAGRCAGVALVALQALRAGGARCRPAAPPGRSPPGCPECACGTGAPVAPSSPVAAPAGPVAPAGPIAPVAPVAPSNLSDLQDLPGRSRLRGRPCRWRRWRPWGLRDRRSCRTRRSCRACGTDRSLRPCRSTLAAGSGRTLGSARSTLSVLRSLGAGRGRGQSRCDDDERECKHDGDDDCAAPAARRNADPPHDFSPLAPQGPGETRPARRRLQLPRGNETRVVASSACLRRPLMRMWRSTPDARRRGGWSGSRCSWSSSPPSQSCSSSAGPAARPARLRPPRRRPPPSRGSDRSRCHPRRCSRSRRVSAGRSTGSGRLQASRTSSPGRAPETCSSAISRRASTSATSGRRSPWSAPIPFPGALAALKAVPNAKTVNLAGGGVLVSTTSDPRSVHLAYPGVDYQIEVYDPVAGRARVIALSGRVRPIR